MAYNYYQNPYYPLYQQIPQLPQTTQQQTPQPSIIWISSEAEAMSYPVAPNNAVTLWSTTEPVVYLKQADATGKPSLKMFDLVERTRTPSVSVSDKGGTLPAYATKDELTAVLGAVKGFDDVIGGIKSDIETMKSDLYGVAGRKKPTKKLKDEDEE